MYKKLSNLFLSSISISLLGLMTVPTFAIDNISGESSNSKVKYPKNFKTSNVVRDEQELINALKNESVNEIIIEGNVLITKNIDLTNLKNSVRIVVGSDNVKNSCLNILEGVEINGDGKLTIVKNNSEGIGIISLKKVVNNGKISQTLFKNLNILGKNGELIFNTTTENLILSDIKVFDSTLFLNEKTDSQVFERVNFINSLVNLNGIKPSKIFGDSIIKTSNSIYFDGYIDSEISRENSLIIAIDNLGEVITSKNIQIDELGDVQASIENLKRSTNYDLYILSFDENQNLFLSSPINVSTTDFKSSVESINHDSAKIKIFKNSLEEKYYPLYVILKYGDYDLRKVEISNKATTANIILNFTGLRENSKYSYEVVSYLDDSKKLIIDKGEFKTLISPSNVGSSNFLNFSIHRDEVKNFNIYDTGVRIPLNETIAKYVRNGKNFETNIKGVNVELIDGKFLITNLIPSTDYSNLKIYFETNDNKNVEVSIPRIVTIQETTNVNKFIKNVYFNAFNRNPDEIGFSYWVEKLSSKEISADKFVKNLLSEDEFGKTRPTIREKIEGLYSVIVNRKSDEEGLKFWVNIYESFISRGYSDEFALKIVVDKMVDADEFKNVVQIDRKSVV